jgi:hypothetical protein
MSQVDVYGTHLEYLQEIFNFKGKIETIIEFGMGNFSTKLLIENGINVTSIEMQYEDWYNKMVSKFSNNKNWTPHKLIGPYEFMNITYPEKVDFVFVDGHGGTRPECINFMMEKNCPIIIAHDTETPSYGWDRVKNDISHKKIHFKKHENWTTLWTTDEKLYNHFIDKNII